LPNIEGELHEQQKREMVAGSCRAVLSGSGGVCHSGHPPTMRRLQGAGAGGWLPCDLPFRSRPHMFRGHVPTIQASKAHAIVNSAGKKRRPLCGYVHSQSGLFCTCFGPASDVTDQRGSANARSTACRAARLVESECKQFSEPYCTDPAEFPPSLLLFRTRGRRTRNQLCSEARPKSDSLTSPERAFSSRNSICWFNDRCSRFARSTSRSLSPCD
jgi:hypothetical protein